MKECDIRWMDDAIWRSDVASNGTPVDYIPRPKLEDKKIEMTA